MPLGGSCGKASTLALVKTGVLAGLLAGLVLGLFHLVVTEPAIEEAIALEEAAAASEAGAASEPVVSRGLQKAMLVVGSGLYGVVIGIVFAGVYQLTRKRLPGSGGLPRAATLAVAAWWAVSFLPFMKYPANPPAVGDPESIFFRQAAYVGLIALSIVAVALAAAAYGRLRRLGWSETAAALSAVGLYAALAVALFLLMPANPDDVSIPAELLWRFRSASLFGQMLFWALLGGAFGLLGRRYLENRTPGLGASLGVAEQGPGGSRSPTE